MINARRVLTGKVPGRYDKKTELLSKKSTDVRSSVCSLSSKLPTSRPTYSVLAEGNKDSELGGIGSNCNNIC